MAITVNAVHRRVQFTSSGSLGPYSFSFKVLASADIRVYVGSTLKTVTTHYTTTLSADGTGSITFTSGNAPASSTIVTIESNQAIERTSDYTTGGDFKAASINDDLDRLAINDQQLETASSRNIQLPVNVNRTTSGTGTSGPLEFPYADTASDQANKYILYDSNGTALTTAGAVASIAGATDANITSPANGSVLIYDSSSAKWIDGVALTGAYTVSGSLATDNVIINGTNIGHTDDTDLIGLASGALTVNGTLTVTGATSLSDVNLTNVGDVALDSISADGTQIDIVLTDNDAAALEIKEGSTAYMTFVTTNSGEKIQVDKALDINAASDFGSNAMTNVNIDSGAVDGTIIGANSAAAGTFAAIAGTSLSVGDGNITNVGDIALDSISADGTQMDITLTDNDAAALEIKEAGNAYVTFVTSNGSEKIQIDKELDINAVSDFGNNAMTNVNIDSGTINGITDLAVADGGTGASSLASGHVLLGQGTSAVGTLDVTAKGSILVGDGSGDPRALSVGSNTHVLVADSSEASGIKWAAASSGADLSSIGENLVPDGDGTRDVGTSAAEFNNVFMRNPHLFARRRNHVMVRVFNNGGTMELAVAGHSWDVGAGDSDLCPDIDDMVTNNYTMPLLNSSTGFGSKPAGVNASDTSCVWFNTSTQTNATNWIGYAINVKQNMAEAYRDCQGVIRTHSNNVDGTTHFRAELQLFYSGGNPLYADTTRYANANYTDWLCLFYAN